MYFLTLKHFKLIFFLISFINIILRTFVLEYSKLRHGHGKLINMHTYS